MIEVIAIGKLKEKAMQNLVEEYSKRIKSHRVIKILELSNSNKTNVKDIIDDETSRIMERIDSSDYVVLLDIRGTNLSSEALADKMLQHLDQAKKIIFVIGGSHGVGTILKDRANLKWSFSHLTFPHQLMRVMLLEQIYRFLMIHKNHPYHK